MRLTLRKGVGVAKGSRVFVTGTIKLIFSHTFSLWLRRNEDVHDRDSATREAAACVLAQREIRCLYAHCLSVPTEIQQVFYSTPETNISNFTLLHPLSRLGLPPGHQSFSVPLHFHIPMVSKHPYLVSPRPSVAGRVGRLIPRG